MNAQDERICVFLHLLDVPCRHLLFVHLSEAQWPLQRLDPLRVVFGEDLLWELTEVSDLSYQRLNLMLLHLPEVNVLFIVPGMELVVSFLAVLMVAEDQIDPKVEFRTDEV